MTTPPAPPIARTVLAATAVVILGAALMPFLLVDESPDPMASRWSFDGEVTSATSPTALLAFVLAAVVPCAGALIAFAVTRREARPGSRPMWAGLAAMLGAIVAGAAVLTVVANRGHTDWQTVPGPAVWQVGALLSLSVAAAVLAAWAGSGLPEAPRPQFRTEPLGVADTAVVAWSRSLTVRWLVALGTALGLLGLALALFTPDPWIGIIVFASALPSGLLARIEVFADRRGLTVAYGPWGWPRTRIPIGRIAAVAAVEIKPSEWGGWGYRGSVTVFRQAAVVLRPGPGLCVELTDGRRFAVTIDDPATAAAVLERERARR